MHYLLLALLCLLIAPEPAAASRICDVTGTDAAAVAAARIDVASQCACDAFSRHSDYMRCSSTVLAARVHSGTLSSLCKRFVQRCAVRSICGRPSYVSCCLTSLKGSTTCRIRRNASRCLAPRGGSACVGTASSCCDACTTSGCAAAPSPTPSPTPPPAASPTPTSCVGACPGTIQSVFIILMENHDWSNILNSASAPYINSTVLPAASYAMQYYNPPGIHPSEPNYLWLEAGTGFGIFDDDDPLQNHQSTTNHLVTLLDAAGVSWKAYQEDISGSVCPLTSEGRYAPKHNPMVFFDDVTNDNDAAAPYCIAHIRPYTELATDLQNGTVARYNFITPNLCNDMHDTCAPLNDSVAQGDTWLATEMPKILQSSAYQQSGVLLITWDEGEGNDGPIGMIVLSPHAKGGGYSNGIPYTHSSTLRTLQEIFGVTPLLGHAATATDLSDLFATFP